MLGQAAPEESENEVDLEELGDVNMEDFKDFDFDHDAEEYKKIEGDVGHGEDEGQGFEMRFGEEQNFSEAEQQSEGEGDRESENASDVEEWE